jgi:HSP20 family protein
MEETTMLSRFFDFDHNLANSLSLMDAFERRLQHPYFDAPRALPGGARRFSELSVRDEGESYTLSAVIPGVPKEELDLSIEGKVLTITAKRKVPAEKEAKASERVLFQKTIELGVDVASDLATATLEDGILKVTLPKVAAAKPRKILISKSEPPPPAQT